MMKKILVFLILLGLLPSPVFAQGVLKGRVTFEGEPPAPEKVEVKSDIATCGHEKVVSKLSLGADRGVANAVVKILGAPGTVETKEAILDQIECEFKPHVIVLPVGSKLKITSSDPVLHNAHGFFEDGSTAFNIAVPIPGMEIPVTLKQPGRIKLRCDAGHTWMSGYIVVTDTPFYAVTDTDGNFTIQGVPAGNYQVEIWQEWAGKRQEPISVREGEQTVAYSLTAPA